MTDREVLKHGLLMKMGLPPGHPTDAELDLIIQYISGIRPVRTPTDADWRAACVKYVERTGEFVYAAQDTSDLNELLMTILRS